MRYRRMGRTGLLVSELCLGTNTFGGGDSEFWRTLGGLDQPAAEAVIASAFEAGINFIDTADAYASGESEQRIGQALRNLGIDRSQAVIATKFGLRRGSGANDMGASRGQVLRALEASLKRLQTDYIDIYMIHFFDVATPLEETLRTLDAAVRDGKVRHVGCSNFAAWQVMKGLRISAAEHLERFEVIEANWSAASRGIERELAPMALDENVGLLIWGPMLGGLLSGKYGRDGTGEGQGRTGGAVPPVIDREQLFDVVDALRSVADRQGATVAQVALAWVLHQKGVTSVLFGARDPAQVADNVKASDIVLSNEDLDAISAAAEPVMDYGPWSMRGSAGARLPYA